jgi:hypothetical protein
VGALFLRFVAELVEEHLMEQMDAAMEHLKMWSILSMGVGSFLQYVSRMEQG